MASASQQHEHPREVREKTRFDPEEYKLRKRLPRCLPKRRNDVYVNMRTNFIAQLKRCQKLLDDGENEIFIHGLGKAVNRAVNVALQLQANNSNALELGTNTSTIDLVDDLEPEIDEVEPQTQTRSNSAIHIKVFRKVPLPNTVANS